MEPKDIFDICVYTYLLASIIVRLTPTKKDDQVLTYLGHILRGLKIILQGYRKK